MVARFSKGQMLAFWMGLGVLFATVALNRLFASGLINYPVLYGYLMQEVEQGLGRDRGVSTFAVVKTVILRSAQTVTVIFLCRSRFRQFFCRAVPAAIGGSAASYIVLLTWSRGIAGLPQFLALWLPQGLLFLAVWVALLLRLASGEEVRQRNFLSAVLSLFMAGILLEILINPWFLRIF